MGGETPLAHRLRHPSRVIRCPIKAGIVLAGPVPELLDVEDLLERVVEHRLDDTDPFLRRLARLRPGAEQSLHQKLEVGPVVATRTEIRSALETDHGRTGVRGAPARPRQRLAPQQLSESMQVHLVGHVEMPTHLVQHGVPRQQAQVVPVHRQCPRVVSQRTLGVPGVVEQVGLGLVDVDHAGDVFDPVEGFLGTRDIVLLQQRLR